MPEPDANVRPYLPREMQDWRESWEMTCKFCARSPGCDICEAMIDHLSGEGPWPEGGFVTDPGAGMSCLSYQPRRDRKPLARQQLRRLARQGEASAPPMCGGCAARKGSEASVSLHTRRDFAASVQDQTIFLCHETGGYCGGWVKAVLAKRGGKA